VTKNRNVRDRSDRTLIDHAIVAVATLTSYEGLKVAASRAARRDFYMKSPLHFCKFLVNPNFDLETDYIFVKPMNRHFQ